MMSLIQKPFQYYSDSDDELDYASKTAYLFVINATCQENKSQIMINEIPIYVG